MCILCVAAAAAAPAAAIDPMLLHEDDFLVANFVSPVLFNVMGVKVYSYGLLVAAALGTAFLIFGQELRRAAIQIDEYTCFFVFLAGFAIGSKAHLALSAIGAGEELSWKAFDIRTGHSFIGSQLGAVAGMILLIKLHGVGILRFLDVLLPCCLLGHAIGKIGCFLSGDGCYGPQADPKAVPWAMSFPNAAVPTAVPVHPTPLYESFLSFLVFMSVRAIFPLRGGEDGQDNESAMPVVGRRTSLLLVMYGVERVLIEPYRRHPPIELFMGLTEYQVLALILLFIGILLELVGRWWGKGAKSKQA
mmetsp:Transcript_13096/g.24102  ORF Transcript_13096/g.24102 Transcript_13096/m.24102 type:complete len:304 (+) Transcript_13096:63-974(+)